MATKKNRKKFKFVGYDYTEIFEAANLEVGFKPTLKTEQKKFISFEDEDKFVENELKRLWQWGFENESNSDKLEDLFRRYLEVFLPMDKRLHYRYPLFVGMSKIKHKDTFLKYCCVLFRHMWN